MHVYTHYVNTYCIADSAERGKNSQSRSIIIPDITTAGQSTPSLSHTLVWMLEACTSLPVGQGFDVSLEVMLCAVVPTSLFAASNRRSVAGRPRCSAPRSGPFTLPLHSATPRAGLLSSMQVFQLCSSVAGTSGNQEGPLHITRERDPVFVRKLHDQAVCTI